MTKRAVTIACGVSLILSIDTLHVAHVFLASRHHLVLRHGDGTERQSPVPRAIVDILSGHAVEMLLNLRMILGTLGHQRHGTDEAGVAASMPTGVLQEILDGVLP